MAFSGYLGVEQPESDAGSLKLSPLPFRITEERTNSTIDIEGEETNACRTKLNKVSTLLLFTCYRSPRRGYSWNTCDFSKNVICTIPHTRKDVKVKRPKRQETRQ